MVTSAPFCEKPRQFLTKRLNRPREDRAPKPNGGANLLAKHIKVVETQIEKCDQAIERDAVVLRAALASTNQWS
jgi:hypothetical protein